MKSYTELTFHIAPFTEDIADALIAELGALNYDGFVYTEDGFKAYTNAAEFDASTVEHLDLLQILPDTLQITWDKAEIADQDWNKEWEEHFTPIFINDQIMVRTGFHPARPEIPYEIIIEPKMSFGTGHHATTALMLESILDFADAIKGKQVLDMGCGTGILSIMASKAGAAHITGIDIDEWAYTNTMENLRNNHLQNVSIKIGDASLLKHEKAFDFILANINRNILLEDMHRYVQHLSPNGYLIMSGFYTQDLPLIQEKAAELNLQFHRQKIKDNWVAASFYLPA
ncbi:50S ribosomal protein L11 methyltransferase [Odoribacter lunatus]|uniref:50S ribosomal protein L11 methyltransferase n=1 Tax=Odoribacter lunatus TaxID=2941335 RepID=UPI00203B2007|nr:50S ribosomal protein L11 methyltransferase [Odoribacter lunatus]